MGTEPLADSAGPPAHRATCRAAALRPRRRAGSTALYTNFAPSHYLSDWELVH